MPLWVMALMLVVIAVAFSGWANEREGSEEKAAAHAQDVERYERNADRLTRLVAGSQAATAIVMQGRQYEAEKAGDLEVKGNDLASQLQYAKRKWNGWMGAAAAYRNEGCRLESILRDNGHNIKSQQLACHKLPKE